MTRLKRCCALLVFGLGVAHAQPQPPTLPPATPAVTDATAATSASATAEPATSAVGAGTASSSDLGPEKSAVAAAANDTSGPTATEIKALPCLGSEDGCSVGDLKTPTTPAFAIIGTAPSQVETPRAPKALALALYNAYNGGAIAQDVALDVAPYWLFAHPELSYDQYIAGPSPLQLLQHASVSIATGPAINATATDVGVGLRTHLFFPDASNSSRKSEVTKAEAKLLGLQAAFQNRGLIESRHCETMPDDVVCATLKKELAEAEAKARVVEADLKTAGKALQDALAARPGFTLSIAGALSSRSAADKFKPNDFQKAAGWVTGGYRGSWFEATAVARFVGVDAPSMKFLDAGARIGAFTPTWGLNGELVYRTVSGDNPPVENSLRLTATLEFKVSGELFVSATYGKDNADESTPGSTFALFGVTFQGGKRKVTKL